MFAHISSIIVASLSLLAVASPIEPIQDLEVRDGSGQCSTGTISCCNSVQSVSYSASSSQVTSLTSWLGIPIPSVPGQVGLNCSPIGGTGGNCVSQTVCCNNVQFNGLINFGCINIAIVL
ncbi:hypothetical protein ID866_5232 [Astraeus odoratus]|nr:hypothetical protein ID866_5232 [Astraeus odoratus]